MENTTQTTEQDRLISLRQAASRLGISTRALYRLMAKGDIPPPVKVGGASRLYESDLNAYMDQLKEKRQKLMFRN